MTYYINYSDDNFLTQQKYALKMALSNGCFDYVNGYNKKDIDNQFNKKYKNILNVKKGGGYWLWKPYFINKKLSEIKYGDYLFYSDSGAFFLRDVNFLIKELENEEQDVMAFENPFLELQWTKKELFINMQCNDTSIKNSNQLRAGLILIKKTNFSISFFKEYLRYATIDNNITDYMYLKQDINFIEHRHDQSIFSLLYKKNKLHLFVDPTQTFLPYVMPSKLFVNGINVNIKLNKVRLRQRLIIFLNRKDNPLNAYNNFKIKYSIWLKIIKYIEIYIKIYFNNYKR